MKLIAYIDGSGNSDRIQACATAIYADEVLIAERAFLLPRGTTNNVGEYNGALLAIRTAIELGGTELHIFSDSKLIVHQIRDEWDCKNLELRQLRDQVWELASFLEKISIQWIPRKENRQADGLCRKAIRLAEKNPFLQVEFASISSDPH